MAVKTFRARHPEFDAIPVVPVSTPDFTGSLESGFAAAVRPSSTSWCPPRQTPAPGPAGARARSTCWPART